MPLMFVGCCPAVAATNPLPTVIDDLSATPGDSQVLLGWTAIGGAVSYNVKRALVTGGPYTTLGIVTVANYADTDVTNDTEYFYVVSANNASGESANSNEASATPTSSSVDLTGLVLWLDSNNITGSDEDSISVWPDSSGNGNDAAVDSVGNPTPILRISDGSRFAEYNGEFGIKPSMAVASAGLSAITDSVTIVVVALLNAGGTGNVILASRDWNSSSPQFGLWATSDGANQGMAVRTSQTTGSLPDNQGDDTYHSYVGTVAAASDSVKFYIDGTELGTAGDQSAGLDALSIGNDHDLLIGNLPLTANGSINGRIRHVLVYDHELSGSDITALLAALPA